MATPLAPFPDVEETLIVLLADIDAEGGTSLPADIKEHLPFLFVYRFAGSDDRITDRAVVGVDILIAGNVVAARAAGVALAEQVRQRLIAAPHVVTVVDDVVVIDNVTTAEAPHEVPYGDSGIRRWVSSYTVSLRR